MKRTIAVGLIGILSACSGTIPVQYVPQTMIKAAGQADIGDFAYQPFLSGHVKPNQIQNTAAGSIFIATDVSRLVQRATAAELEKAGIHLGPDAPVRLTGLVKTFKASDIGFNVRWNYTVEYTITRKSDSVILLKKDYSSPQMKTGKFGQASDFGPSINELILSGVESFLRDPDAIRALRTAS